MKINFDVKFVSGLVGSLNIQIIPLDLRRNNDCVGSIAIDEVAFSLVENFFNRDKEKFFHWGITFINSENLKDIIKDLHELHSFINQLDTYDKTLKLIFKEETELFASNFSFFKPQALNMIIEITKFLEKAENEYDGITLLGV
ncbi:MULTISPECIES: hypothetical protein [Acinetobacter]|jgi:hypothetical protein|uniref:DUF1877 family protein n=1 Tax=Acinetobacter geminorum TaxID=2730922 RepID=A0ABT8Z8I2_9GAMM|nr:MULTISPECIES: hypothetical protein [Acinetobacter]MBJ8432669.1 hypothetical protein [Acinetobacter pittii]MBN6519149.1 hypothetical protein [Acinetobacter pittii]MCU4360162.1 hypothetical protein [Acinetobacter sp. WU_MDCI_Abxc22]MDO7361046.1 hypothetical protein [Acinetobacter geminorum]MDX8273882.1 hypothetical protein [Acinetobacter pittii]